MLTQRVLCEKMFQHFYRLGPKRNRFQDEAKQHADDRVGFCVLFSRFVACFLSLAWLAVIPEVFPPFFLRCSDCRRLIANELNLDRFLVVLFFLKFGTCYQRSRTRKTVHSGRFIVRCFVRRLTVGFCGQSVSGRAKR